MFIWQDEHKVLATDQLKTFLGQPSSPRSSVYPLFQLCVQLTMSAAALDELQDKLIFILLLHWACVTDDFYPLWPVFGVPSAQNASKRFKARLW